jgi:hypothetical protein
VGDRVGVVALVKTVADAVLATGVADDIGFAGASATTLALNYARGLVDNNKVTRAVANVEGEGEIVGSIVTVSCIGTVDGATGTGGSATLSVGRRID